MSRGLRAVVLTAVAMALALPASADAAPVLAAQYGAQNCFPGAVEASTNVAASEISESAQTFVPSVTGQVGQVDLALFSFGVSQPLTVQILNTVSGTPGTTVLGSGTLPASAAPTSSVQFFSIPLSSPAPVTAGTQYAIHISSATSHPGWQWCGDAAGTYPDGHSWSRVGQPPSGTAWASNPIGVAADLGFKVWVDDLAAQYGAQNCFPGAVEASTNVAASEISESAQTFVPSVTGQVGQVDLALFSFGVSQPLTVQILNTVSGTPGTTVLGSGTLPASAAPTSSVQFFSIPLSSPAPVTAGTQYAIHISSATSHPGWQWCGDAAGTYPDGHSWSRVGQPPSGTPWASNPIGVAADLGFKVHLAAAGAVAPTVTTDAASGVTTTGAQLNATINAGGAATTYRYEYGPTTTFGTAVPAAGTLSAGSGSTAVAQPPQAISGLAPATTYYYRACANNSVTGTGVANQVCGAVRAFTTSGSSAPSATTGAASSVTATGASIAGTVNAHGQATAYTVEYGTTTSFGSITAPASAGSSTAGLAVTVPMGGLSPGTTYYYRLVATNATGTTVGALMSFTTVPTAPTVATGAASAITSTSATLSGTLNPRNGGTAFTFEYGTTTDFGSLTAVDFVPGAPAVSRTVSLPATGLSPGTKYYYRLVATNANGTTNGTVVSFTTAGV